MSWRLIFRLACIEILLDGFLIYFFFTQPLLFFFKDVILAFILFFMMPKEPVKEYLSDLGRTLGAGVVLLMSGLFAVGFLQIFNPMSPGLLRGILGFKVMFLPWLGIFLGFVYVNTEEDAAGLFRLIAFMSIPINLFGVIQYIQGPEFMPATFGPGFLVTTQVANIYGVKYEESFVRIIGTFASSGAYALFLSMNLLVCLTLYFIDRRKWLWLGASLLNCFALLATGSRGGFLSALFMVFIFASLFRKARTTITVLLIVCGGIFLGFSTLRQSVFQRFQTAARIETVKERTIATAPKQFVQNLENYPMGKGIGAASQAARHLGKVEGKFVLVENYLSKLQVEIGIVGVILFYLLIAMIMLRWFNSWMAAPFSERTYVMVLAMTAYCFGQFTIGGIFSSIDTPPASYFIWIFMGMAAKLSLVVPEEFETRY